MTTGLHFLYHMRRVGCADLNDGYIGVCSDMAKRKWKHLNYPVNDITRSVIASGEPIEFVVLMEGPRENCLLSEATLRPRPNMGWNVKTGGADSEFPQDVKDHLAAKKIGNTNVGKGEAHHFFGKTGKDAVRYGTRGAKSPSHIGKWVTPLGEFESMSLAADAHGCAKSTVLYRCVKSDGFPEWKFVANNKEE